MQECVLFSSYLLYGKLKHIRPMKKTNLHARIEIRSTCELKTLIERAAVRQNIPVSKFMRDVIAREARAVLQET